MQGRILVFSVRECKLHLVAEKEVKGAAYNINPFQARSVLVLDEMVRGLPLRVLAVMVAGGHAA